MDTVTAASGIAQGHSAKGAVLGATLSVPSVLLGAQMDSLFVGLAAAVFVAIWLERIDGRAKAAAAVLFSTLLAGYGSPVAARYAADMLPVVAGDDNTLRLLLALLIGACTPRLFPLLLRRAARKGGET